jgi:hypothetical protein
MRALLSKLWVRNVIGAVVTLAALGVIVATDLGKSWAEYRQTVVPGAVVPAGKSGEADGRTWKIDSIRHLNRNPSRFGPPLPEGTVLTVITVDRSGEPYTDVMCKGVLIDGERRWSSEGIGGYSVPDTDGVTSMCSAPGKLRYTFLHPQEVVPTAMDIVQLDGRIIVRLLL